MRSLLKQATLSLLLLAVVSGNSIAATTEPAAIDKNISRLLELETSRGLQPEEYFELGTLYWEKRDFARRSYGKNDLTRKASRSFLKYAQANEPAARHAIALFCVERIRQSTHLGIRASDDFLACSTMFSRYISSEADLLRDDGLDDLIQQEMAKEVLYDICYRFSDWEFIHLKRLGEALLQSNLVDVNRDLLAEALIGNLESRLGLNHMQPLKELTQADFREAFQLAQYLDGEELSETNREGLEVVVLNAFAEGEKLAGLGQELVNEASRSLKQAKASIIVYHQTHDQLPQSLQETGYDAADMPSFANGIHLDGNQLSLTFSDQLIVPKSMVGSKLVRTIGIESGMVVDNCTPSSNIPQRYLPEALSCS